MVKREGRRTLFCSFCRKSNREVGKLIGGPGVYICDTCVGHCNTILEGKPGPGFPEWNMLETEDLLAALHPSEAAVESSRDVLQDQIDVLRSRSVSWAAIGKALGITRQAAWERFS